MEPKGSEPAKSRVPICAAVIKFSSWQVSKHIGNLFGSIFLLFSLETSRDRGWTYSRGDSVRTVEDRSQERHTPHFVVQGRMQTWSQIMWNLSKQLGSCCWCSYLLEMDSERGNRESRCETSPQSWREVGRKSSFTLPSSNFICVASSRNCHLALYWPTQPHKRCSSTTD